MPKFSLLTVVAALMLVIPAIAQESADQPKVITAVAESVATPEAPAKRIDVVFVLDTTGSMSGLIQAAKEKIWAIANTLSAAQPAPVIRMGLVAYRDRGDEYVTRITKLNTDLDSVYGELMAFVADGGNDQPESVNQALYEAVNLMEWEPGDGVYRVIYLVGDAPPHLDYDDDVQYTESCREAVQRGIFINTIQCGGITETTPVWTQVAGLTDGLYAAIEQSGGAILPASPFDEEIAKMSRQLDETRIYYGNASVREQQQLKLDIGQKIYEKASVNSVAQRAAFFACPSGNSSFCGFQELVNDFSAGKLKLSDIKQEDLPEKLRGLTVEKLTAILNARDAERKEIQATIMNLSEKRQAWLKEELAKHGKDEPALDRIVFDAIKIQAATQGIDFTADAPSL